MHDAAVAPGLVRGETVLLLEERHLGVGSELEQPARDCGADDPAAHHGVTLRGHRCFSDRVAARRTTRAGRTASAGRYGVAVIAVTVFEYAGRALLQGSSR